MLWKRPGIFWSSIWIWVRMIEAYRKSCLMLFSLLLILCTACQRENTDVNHIERDASATDSNQSAELKPYDDLTHDSKSVEEARQDILRIMENYEELYKNAEKGNTANVVLENDIINDILDKLSGIGEPVYTSLPYQNMCGGDKMDLFLNQCKKGIPGKLTIYQIHYDGGLGREEYLFDGKTMRLFSMISSWDGSDNSVISDMEEYEIDEWFYSKKGYFGYQLDVPEPPEVSEIIDGSMLIRVAPLEKEYIRYSKDYVYPISYAGNNLLSSDWDASHMEKIDYNGLFDSFYKMESGHQYKGSWDNQENVSESLGERNDPSGIPQREFEQIMMKYLPINREQLRKYAAYDKNSKIYPWEELYCMNYAPTSFGTSLPEVVDVRENPDHTLTLTVEAVCDHVLCDDALITSELTIQINDRQEVRYLENRVISGKENIPEYQYRIVR